MAFASACFLKPDAMFWLAAAAKAENALPYSLMLKKTNRLAKTKDIQRTTMRGRSFFNPNLVLKYHRNTADPKGLRFTVTVTTRVSKNAVARNRIKRVIRETLRTNIEHFRPGDYVVVVRAAMVSMAAKDIPGLVLSVMTKSGLYL